MTSIYSPQLFSKLSSEWYLATALYDAIDDGNLREVAILLHEKHADPNVVIPDYDITPFHLAVGHENELFAKEVTKLLLKNGGDPNVRDNEGVTPLHVAAVWNRSNIVRLLLSYGGDPMITDGAEKNAFHYAYEEHAWETLKTLEIHRRAKMNENEVEKEKSYSIHLEKVIIHGNGVQAEYRTLCEGCKKDMVISKQSVATQTPLPHVKLPEPNDSDDLETYFDAENMSSSKIRPSCYDWCEQACGTVLTDDCKRKITSHRTKSRVYEYNPIFERKTSSSINQPAHDYKKLMCCAVVSDLDNSRGDDILRDSNKNIAKIIETVEMKTLTKATVSTSTSNLAELKENGSGENFSEDSLTPPKTTAKESPFDNVNIPYIDESSTGSSQNCDKNKSTTSEEKERSVRIEEPPVASELPPILEPKEATKHVSWSGCLSTCACIPNRLNESESSVYFTNPESDDEKSKADPNSMLSGVLELSKTQNHSSLITNDESFPNAAKSPINHNKSLISNDESQPNAAKSFMTDDKSLMDVSLINNAPSPRTGLNISVEYKYTDDEDGIEFVEAKLPLYVSATSSAASTPTKNLMKCITGRIEESETSDGTAYDTDYIRTELKRLGFNSGPIAGTTKKLYLKKLRRIRKSVPDSETPIIKPVFSPELEQVLREDNYEWEKTINKWSVYENDILVHFSDTSFSNSWRCGTAKTSFTYLLLDPRISNNLPARCEQMDLGDVWRDFVHAIFYVGKGTRARPYEHLHEAFLVWKETKAYPRKRCNLKVRHILDIWNDGLGVVCLQAFHNIIPAEAYTREAAMIDAIGLSRLKNEKGGMYYGVASSWNPKQKRRLGVYLLYRAMRMFIADNEVQLKPTDVK